MIAGSNSSNTMSLPELPFSSFVSLCATSSRKTNLISAVETIFLLPLYSLGPCFVLVLITNLFLFQAVVINIINTLKLSGNFLSVLNQALCQTN